MFSEGFCFTLTCRIHFYLVKNLEGLEFGEQGLQFKDEEDKFKEGLNLGVGD